jgi:hypothetical protein
MVKKEEEGEEEGEGRGSSCVATYQCSTGFQNKRNQV